VGSDWIEGDLLRDFMKASKRRGRERGAAHSEAQGEERFLGTDRLGQNSKDATEEVTWDSIVVPRLTK